MRTIAIGDIHGCSQALQTIIQAIRPTANDLLITLGDYIDRGPDSRGVLEQLLALDKQCRLVPLLGNHEIMLLGILADPGQIGFWQQCGGMETLASYGGTLSRIPEQHWAFFKRCRPYYEMDHHIFLHANYVAALPMAEQPDYALFWEHISPNVPPPHESGKTVILGHTPQTSGEILDVGHLICLDTYCFGRGWLSALDVTSGEIWQADKYGTLRAKQEGRGE